MPDNNVTTEAVKSNHTPGPWIAKFDENGGYDCMSDAISVGPSGNGYQPSVVHIDLGKNPSVTTEMKAWANAHLIAAAPDLLTALSEYMPAAAGVLAAVETRIDLAGALERFTEATRTAAAAIARAEGTAK